MRHLSLVIASLLLLPAVSTPAEAQSSAFDRALKAQERRAANNPDNPAVLNDLGNLLAIDGRVDEAIEAYSRALALAPEHAAARFNLALVLYESGEVRRAHRQLRRLLKAHPDHAWGHYQTGTLLAHKGSDQKAVEHYTQALLLDPRLLEPEVNPHIISNRLRLHAMVRAYRLSPPSELAPRVFANPRQVRRMLTPRVKPPPTPAAVEESAQPQAEIPIEEVEAPDG